MDTVTITRSSAYEALLALRMLRHQYVQYVNQGDEDGHWKDSLEKTNAAIAEVEEALA